MKLSALLQCAVPPWPYQQYEIIPEKKVPPEKGGSVDVYVDQESWDAFLFASTMRPVEFE